MKGQVDIVSIIIITGVIIALIGTVYSWSVPLVNKGQADTIFRTATSFVRSLDSEVTRVANSGGEVSLDINPPGGLVRVIPAGSPDPLENTIIFELPVSQPLAFDTADTYISEVTFAETSGGTGTFGSSSPGIIKFRVVPLGSQWKAVYEIHYRTLEDKNTNKEYKITLNQGGEGVASGRSRINLRLEGTTTAVVSGIIISTTNIIVTVV